MTFIAFALALLSTLRLTRLAIHDDITQPWRDKLIMGYAMAMSRAQDYRDMDDDQLVAGLFVGRTASATAKSYDRRAKVYDWFSRLFGCPWCIGFWISAVAAAAALHVAPVALPLWYAYPAYTLALSYLTGVIYTAVFTLEEYDPNR